jgi:hypothetical protein
VIHNRKGLTSDRGSRNDVAIEELEETPDGDENGEKVIWVYFFPRLIPVILGLRWYSVRLKNNMVTDKGPPILGLVQFVH